MIHIVNFSGGKDSTAMLYKMIEKGYEIDEVLHAELPGMKFPESRNHIELIKKDMEDKDIKFTSIRHKNTYEDLVVKNGWTTIHNRWCTSKLKLEVLRRYLRKTYPKDIIFEYVGIAYDERHRIPKVSRTRALKYYKKYPLVKMRMTEQECLDYSRSLGFDWDGLYDIFDRDNCFLCPMQNMSSLRKLYKYYPQLWEKLKYIDAKVQRNPKQNIIKKFKYRYSIEDLEDKFKKEIETKDFHRKLNKKFQ